MGPRSFSRSLRIYNIPRDPINERLPRRRCLIPQNNHNTAGPLEGFSGSDWGMSGIAGSGMIFGDGGSENEQLRSGSYADRNVGGQILFGTLTGIKRPCVPFRSRASAAFLLHSVWMIVIMTCPLTDRSIRSSRPANKPLLTEHLPAGNASEHPAKPLKR